MTSLTKEKQRLKDSLFVPIVFVAILWFIKLAETFFGISFAEYGIRPRTIEGLRGVLFSPLIHGGFQHLFSNSIPIIVLGFIVLYSYQKISYSLIGWLYFMSGIWTWAIARPSYHIGASGVVYGLAFFIFFSGVFRKDIRSMALALLVTFSYGGIIWGLLPLKEGVSFEGHIAGALAGILCAYYYKGVNPPPKHDWGEEEEEKDIIGKPFWVKEKKEVPPPIAPSPTATQRQIQIDDTPPKTSNDILGWEVKYNYVDKKKDEQE